jgi:membrane-bound lytic murein transglycosylase B
MISRKTTFTLVSTALLLLSACQSQPPKATQTSLNPVESKTKPNEQAPFNQSNSLINIDNFISDVSQRNAIPLDILKDSFTDIKPQASARKLVSPPISTAKKNWRGFRKNFIEPVRLNAGQKFWEDNRAFLEKTEKETGVPVEILVGIIGIETMYGSNMGNFPVRDVLVTLAFDYPPAPNKDARETMFRGQLEDLVIYCWKESQKKSAAFKTCLKQPSSFAGAIGMPQFMPTSILKYAKDGNGDGVIDIRNNTEDAIASVASFMVGHGWKRNEPIFLEIANNETAITNAKALADGSPDPKYTLGLLKQQKIIDGWPKTLTESSPALIVDLPTNDKNGDSFVDYVVGLKNFEVITLYNRSFFYAKIVTDFGYAVGQRVKKTKQEKRP